MPKVYIPVNTGHDFTSAKEYGELIILSKHVGQHDAALLLRILTAATREASPNDYILVVPFTLGSIVLSSIFAQRFGRLNLLLFNPESDKYVLRKLNIVELTKE